MLLLTIALTLFLTTPAHALTTIFTDQATFDAVVGPTTPESFGNAPTVTYGTFSNGSPDIDFVTYNFDSLLTISGDRGSFVGAIPSGGGLYCFCTHFGAGGIEMYTASPVYALGLYVTPLQPNATFTFLGARYLLADGTQFFGFLSDTPVIGDFGQAIGLTSWEPSLLRIDNVEIKTVPEPSAPLLLSLAMIILCGNSLGRRLQRTSKTPTLAQWGEVTAAFL